VGSILRKLDLPVDATENRRVLAVLAFLGAIEQFGEPGLRSQRSDSSSP